MDIREEFKELIQRDRETIRAYSLKVGMTKEQVLKLLGEPNEIRKEEEGCSWRYGPIISQRLLTFEKEKLSCFIKFN